MTAQDLKQAKAKEKKAEHAKAEKPAKVEHVKPEKPAKVEHVKAEKPVEPDTGGKGHGKDKP